MTEKKQVLIVCSSAAGQMYLGILLNRIWYSPILAKTPAEALLLARYNQFSLILYDGDVADLELQGTIRLLRKEPSLKSNPLVVVMTTNR